MRSIEHSVKFEDFLCDLRELAAREAVYINSLRGPGHSRYCTTCVGVVCAFNTATKLVVTTETWENQAPNSLRERLSETRAEWRGNASPQVVRRRQRYSEITSTGNIELYIKKKRSSPNGETRHHAEQRLVSSLLSSEKLVAIAPSRQCCPECSQVLRQCGYYWSLPTSLISI